MTSSAPGERLYYLSDYSDEIIPCAPTLDAWAEWLSAPSEDWNRTQAAANGDTFKATASDVLADVTATYLGAGEWEHPAPPAEATGFVARFGPNSGWDAETWSCSVESLLSGEAEITVPDVGDQVIIACVRDQPDIVIRFEVTPNGPRCVVLGEAQ